MSTYHLSGTASALFVTLALTGLLLQVRFLRTRRRQFLAGDLPEPPTQTISLNRFAAAYLGYYSLFAYGLFLPALNHYLVLPRILALFLILLILHAIMRDRRDPLSRLTFYTSLTLFIASPVLRLLGAGTLTHSTLVTQIIVIFAVLFFVQGATHQVIKIRRSRRTGGLSLGMHQLTALKDLCSLWFGVAMGTAGWPLLLFHGISIIMQTTIIYHFRWIRKK